MKAMILLLLFSMTTLQVEARNADSFWEMRNSSKSTLDKEIMFAKEKAKTDRYWSNTLADLEKTRADLEKTFADFDSVSVHSGATKNNEKLLFQVSDEAKNIQDKIKEILSIPGDKKMNYHSEALRGLAEFQGKLYFATIAYITNENSNTKTAVQQLLENAPRFVNYTTSYIKSEEEQHIAYTKQNEEKRKQEEEKRKQEETGKRAKNEMNALLQSMVNKGNSLISSATSSDTKEILENFVAHAKELLWQEKHYYNLPYDKSNKILEDVEKVKSMLGKLGKLNLKHGNEDKIYKMYNIISRINTLTTQIVDFANSSNTEPATQTTYTTKIPNAERNVVNSSPTPPQQSVPQF